MLRPSRQSTKKDEHWPSDMEQKILSESFPSLKVWMLIFQLIVSSLLLNAELDPGSNVGIYVKQRYFVNCGASPFHQRKGPQYLGEEYIGAPSQHSF